ncbi:MAG TPA: methyltransferase [Cyclobacteriaceae bacterium]|nr:methyltransferase [Cyclobacteriaceae bacterium]HMV08392.1 methyltransferase [Cyclobacteriaceae bacterium]HMV89681.1 methyltransferase [Cyclobacteriaceae bacterium]HMX01165.1 methyltransferase [Cyclobacteriaceae bacterium]HMX50568.1 methyltransferase [Cyclobacteriaceae bacterium]
MDRTRFTGVTNIVRFNWHFYVMAGLLSALLFVSSTFMSGIPSAMLNIFAALILSGTVVSLVVSSYIYDFSNLYTFKWLNVWSTASHIVNIHAGFDETSHLIKKIYPGVQLKIFDFYDPKKHTEVSIERARRAFPPPPETIKISTDYIPLAENSTDIIFLVLAAHEIRDAKERSSFFTKLSGSLNREGRIIVIEHLRDLNNFMAFNLGFFHFFSKKSWLSVFRQAGLTIESELKITPFISAFILQKNGSAS